MKQPKTLPIAEAAPRGIGCADLLGQPAKINLRQVNCIPPESGRHIENHPWRQSLIPHIKQKHWLVRKFRSQDAQNQWCEKHKHELQIVPLFVNNGYAVEFRKLKQL